MLNCKFCNKKCTNNNSLRNHERLCKLNPSRIPTWLEKNAHCNGRGWNKGLTKETDARVAEYGRKIKEGIESGKISRPGGAIQTPQGLISLSVAAKKNKLGGHTSKKKMKYIRKDGSIVFLQSSYEIRLASLLDELSIEWIRPEPLQWLDSAGASHRYYPDFQIKDFFIDTKNDYLIKKDKEKIQAVMSQNNVKIYVLSEGQINKDYIIKNLLE